MNLDPTSPAKAELERLRLRIEAAALDGRPSEVIEVARSGKEGARALRWGFGGDLRSDRRVPFSEWCAKHGREDVLAELLAAGVPGVDLYELCNFASLAGGVAQAGVYLCPYLAAVNLVSPRLLDIARQHLAPMASEAVSGNAMRSAHFTCLSRVPTVKPGAGAVAERRLEVCAQLLVLGCQPKSLVQRGDSAVESALFQSTWTPESRPYAERALHMYVAAGMFLPTPALLRGCVDKGDTRAAAALAREMDLDVLKAALAVSESRDTSEASAAVLQVFMERQIAQDPGAATAKTIRRADRLGL